ncbi:MULTISPECIES: bifunctional glutamate--cysteine ligase GshA/glutathione synthetase GshB [Paenibacillus]|jgi:glutamate--cysteine ligase|uniref:Glutathione biosynthesis bifunctional protein GshAB n=1 Tax=Paenibacillus glucanolyticus TaxID=59843 RepID=A0A168EVJ5_9BACL|nr:MULTISPECIES: bifunctional glutamate--cysteine ligase GshA/glutathione synthetase GshB [Paenibacillus]MCA4754197.1 bifunctional glutamate--cysteine ligase GshA/glutathione synthetase GshB [Mycolicibacterium fortuitum]ETT40438.1 bifunctional glutamate--cysteine ligase/glutathione synthetase [Paenibacillus sp. FSL R5-808]KZS44872.1 bifunctional glutamate--cysteine ligase/glutathione synthetase [Paenibacillus glucanolyticus]MEC0254893.1 bifunctional glutamate--cysteine ligase GshA/glutathione s
MKLLNRELIEVVIDHALQNDLLRGHFGLEKENVRVDQDGKLALTPHPKAFGSKTENPYIQTDFSESQIEMITPAFKSIEETYHFMEALQDIVSVELEGEYLWPSSNPPMLPEENEIPIAKMSDPIADDYRNELADKYGRKRQLLSGIHYNFSFDEKFLTKLYDTQGRHKDFKEFKDAIYFKVARNLMRYRWLLIYLTGASPVFDNTYIEQCVNLADSHDNKSYYFPIMNSLRNSMCGYRNEKSYYVSFHSAKEYVHDLNRLIQQNELLSVKEFYSPVRLKTAKGINPCQELVEDGVAYLELRFMDINPLHKIGISKEMMHFIHLFILFMLLKVDESFHEEDQRIADVNQDQVIMEGIKGYLNEPEYSHFTMEEMALAVIDEMKDMVQLLFPKNEDYQHILDSEKQKILHTELNVASRVKSEIQKSSYLTYHLEKAKTYAQNSIQNGYRFAGYEDLELSTQLLLKAAVKRGIRFKWMDRDENFVLLSKGNHQEYVKQATKTSLDSYSTVLIMENKVVTKEVLKQHGIRVPSGEAFQSLDEAMSTYETYRGTPIVIKPKSTNFGLGITIFNQDYSREDMKKAFEIAFSHDQTVLLEEFMTGKEYRFLVMGDQVVGVLHRVPANVVGDGIHTIEQLVHEKNKDPLRGKGYKTPLEKIQLGEAEEMFLKNRGMSWNDIPQLGEVIYLRENSNISTGGDSIDFTDEMPNSYKELAIQSAKAAGATICGVDMMIDSLEEEATDTNYSIIEINFNPAIHIHCYPYIGKNRKANEKILDLLFG